MQNFENEKLNSVVDTTEEVAEVVTSKLPKWAKELIEWVIVLAVAAIIAFLLNTFVLKLAVVNGKSMEPTLQHGDRLYVNKLFYTPERGDVVIVNAKDYAGTNGFNEKEVFWVKRVVAIEGDTLYIDFNTGDVYVNGEIVDEPYINEPTLTSKHYMQEYTKENPLVIEEGEVFVMGDNRNHSGDSRIVGPIPVENIEGHAVFRFWPINKMTWLDYSFEENND